MPSEKSGRPQDTEEDNAECGGSPPTEESDMNVDSPAPLEETSSSERTGESVLCEAESESPGSARSDLKDAGSSVTAEEPTAEAKSSGSSASKSVFDCMKVASPFKRSPSKAVAESASQEESQKTKGKSCTPKKEETSKQQASPTRHTMVSPKAKSEEGEATGPVKSGKLGFLQRIISPKKSSQQDEDAPLTAAASPKGSGKTKKGLLGFFGRKSETKQASEIAPGKGEIPKSEEASDSTDATNLSPSSSSSGQKGAGPESGFFDIASEAPQLDREGQKTSEESSESTQGSVVESSSSGAVSGELAADQAEATANETTDDENPPQEKPPSEPVADGETKD